MSKVESIRPKPAQSNRQNASCFPAVALCPVTLLLLAEDLLAQTDGVLPGGAVGNVPVGPAGG